MISKILTAILGSKRQQDLKQFIPIVNLINQEEMWAINLCDDEFALQTQRWRTDLQNGTNIESIVPKAFALAREAARRILGERLYDTQIIGALSLHRGTITEMKTGEGKTLTSVPAAYINSLMGKGVHMVTVNDYLATRDALWMQKVYELLGISVGIITADMDNALRRDAYNKDITYVTNNELGFDYLRDNMRFTYDGRMQKQHYYCIIDEIDSILIDEARTPLIISGAVKDESIHIYQAMIKIVKDLVECEKDVSTNEYPEEDIIGDFKLNEKNKNVSFTDEGLNHLETILLKSKMITGSLFDTPNIEYIHHATQALRALYLYSRDIEYMVQNGKVEIIDEFTGRVLTGRRYADGLHQAIEAKERIKIAQRNRTMATITFQNFFRMYDKIAGMTGTAATEEKEFQRIYGLSVIVVPTNRPIMRNDENDRIYLNESGKLNAIVNEITQVHATGQPILVGTVSVEKSERLSMLLKKKNIKHEILNAKNHEREASIIAEAGAQGAVTIATNMAGRGTDIKLGGNPEYRARKYADPHEDLDVYTQVYEKIRTQWQQDTHNIKKYGGLCVIATERHESRRIDNQLRGRSGRQGDPGRSIFFISMDDDLMRLFGNNRDRMKSMMKRLGMDEKEALDHSMMNKAIEQAQNKVEHRNFDIRKRLLDFDNVLSKQRTDIYQQREDILQDNAIIERLKRTVRIVLEDNSIAYESSHGDKNMLEQYLDTIQNILLYRPQKSINELMTINPTELKSVLLHEIIDDFQHKERLVDTYELNQALRFEYLRSIDMMWQEHLEALSELREAVYLRGYAQKNPLQEYQKEAQFAFESMKERIRNTVVKKLVMLNVVESVEAQKQVSSNNFTGIASHQSSNNFDRIHNSEQNRRQLPGQNKVMPIRNQQQKIGRNDVCPCGSGKKYKNCHGRSL